MSDSHAKLPKLFWIQLALAAIIGIIFLLTPSKHGGGGEHGDASTGKVEAVAKNLAPAGAVAVAEKKDSAGAGKARSGEEVYKASCQACHATGVANAPKLDDKAAWEPRVAAGFDALMNTAINGKGAMPARGGNPAITDAEIEATIIYMAGKAGFDLKSEKKTEVKPATTTEIKHAESADKSVPVTTSTTSSSAVVSAKEEATAKTAVSSPVAPSAPAAPLAPITSEAPALTKPESATAPPIETAVIASADNHDKPSSGTSNKEGEKVYKSACFACHDMGIAGSPKLGDKAAWTTRLATGNKALYLSAISGKGVMPPKGGNMGLSDDAVKAAVDYMTANVQ